MTGQDDPAHKDLNPDPGHVHEVTSHSHHKDDHEHQEDGVRDNYHISDQSRVISSGQNNDRAKPDGDRKQDHSPGQDRNDRKLVEQTRSGANGHFSSFVSIFLICLLLV